MSTVAGNTFLIRTANGRFDMLSVSRASLAPAPVTIGSVTTSASPYTYPYTAADVKGTSITNGINYNVYSFASVSATTTYTVNYSCTSATVIYVLAVGGGGGGAIAGGGGGAGGVVMTPINIPSGSNTISISVGAGGIGATTGSSTKLLFSANTLLNVTAGGGGSGTSYSGTIGGPGSSDGGSGGGGGGSASSYAGGISNNNNLNFANNGGIADTNRGSGGGGAGTPGNNCSWIANGRPGNGGDGIQCYLPGIKDFAPAGKPYINYYWGGGGGGGYGAYGSGGKGGGGAAPAAGTTGPFGLGDSNGINISVNATGGGGSPGATNTGGGGGAGGGNGSDTPAAGGSGIVIIAFPAYTITSNQSAVLPASIVSSGLYSATLNNATLSSLAYSSIKGAFACRLLNYNYFGPVMTLRHTLDTTGLYTQNFYSDICGNMGTGYLGTGLSVSNWLSANGANTTYAFVTKWYGQGMDVSFNSATQYTTTVQPIYDVTNGLINFGYTGGTGVSAPQNGYLNLNNSAYPFADSSYSFVTRHGNYNGSNSMSIYSGGTNGGSSTLLLNGGSGGTPVANYYYVWWSGNDLASSGANMAPNNVVSNLYASTGGGTMGTRVLYVNGTQNATGTSAGTAGLHISTNVNNYIGNSTYTNYTYVNSNYQLYNLFVFSSSIVANDRQIVEATPYQYSVLPSITLTLVNTTATTFQVSGTAVSNATSYAIFVNGSYNTTVTVASGAALPTTTITPGYNGPWSINVYAYSAANNLLARGYFKVFINAVSMTSLLGYYPLNTNDFNYALATPVKDGVNSGTLTYSALSYVGTGSVICSSTGPIYFGSLPITLPASPTTTTGQYTFSLWFYATSFSNNPVIFNVGNTLGSIATNALELWLNGTSLATNILVSGTSVINSIISPTVTVATSAWNHAAMTVQYNASGNNTVYIIYYNGIQVFTTTNVFPSFGTSYPSFGGGNTGTVTLNGNVQECRIYNRVLSAAEILTLYNNHN